MKQKIYVLDLETWVAYSEWEEYNSPMLGYQGYAVASKDNKPLGFIPNHRATLLGKKELEQLKQHENVVIV